MDYMPELKNQRENMAFFENLETWLTRQDMFMRLPELGEKRKARSLEVTSSAYPFIVNEDERTARYQIQLRLIYLQEV